MKDEVFYPAGPIKHAIKDALAFRIAKRLIWLVIAVGLLWYLQHSFQRIVDAWWIIALSAFLVFLYQLALEDKPVIFLTENGVVVERVPLTMGERMESYILRRRRYVYVEYKQVVGFTEDWRTLQFTGPNGGIYMLPIELQMVAYKDKMKILTAIAEAMES